MKKIGLIVLLLCFAAMPLMAVDFTGSFEYEVTIGEMLQADGSYGDMSLEMAVEIDERNTVHAEISADMGDPLTIEDIYLETVYDPVTIQLGSIDLESSGWAVTDDESESSAVGMEGDGATATFGVADTGMSFGLGIGVAEDNKADFGATLAFSKDALDNFELSAFRSGEFGAAVTVIVDRFTIGAGITYDDVVAYGAGIKVAIGPAWVAFGGNNDKVFVGDVGAEWDTIGGMISARSDTTIPFDEISVWWQPAGVKYKGGYRFQDRDIFVNVSADF